MLRKLYSIVLLFSLSLMSAHFAFGKQTGTWDEVKRYANSEVVIKRQSGKKIYGVIRSIDDSGMKIQLAQDKGLDPNETFIPRDEIRKIWRATLFANERKFGTGIVVGAAVGALALGVPSVATKGENAGLDPLSFLVGAAVGGLIGGLVGTFVKKKHKRGDLIYSR